MGLVGAVFWSACAGTWIQHLVIVWNGDELTILSGRSVVVALACDDQR